MTRRPTPLPALALLGLLLAGPALAQGQSPAEGPGATQSTPPAEPPRMLGGAYAGVFLGGVRISSTVEAPAIGPLPARQVDDEGASGFLFGAVAGYGHRFANGVYLAAEFELALPQDVVSTVRIHGREIRARLTTDGGFFVRAGYSWDGRSLVFARGGLTIPRQAFETVGGREVANRLLPSPAVGAGFELPITRAIAFRADVTYTFPGGENAVDSLRGTLGLSYRF
jgi:hypothetical protein